MRNPSRVRGSGRDRVSLGRRHLLADSGGDDYIPVYTEQDKSQVAAQTNQFIGSTPFPLWAYYPAPPASVTSMSVLLPTGVKVQGVPISNSAPPLP
jgi:hypothetical protein